MLKLKHSGLIVIAGIVWLAVGVFLLNMGLRLIATSALEISQEFPLLNWFATLFGGIQQAAIAIIGVSLLVGYFKGRFVLFKTVRRMVNRIRTFKEPVSFHLIYSLKFYILIALMIGLGATIRMLGTPNDVRGMVDVIIGSALINGSIHYFRMAAVPKAEIIG